jgi:prevent-host-death family protein
MNAWQVQDAKARFSELLDATTSRGPQLVTRRGVEIAVLVPFEQWRRAQQATRPSLKTCLLGPGPRFENLVPKRRKFKRRPPLEFK